MPVPLRSANSRADAKYNVTTDFQSLGLHGAAASGNIGLVEYALGRGQPVNSVVDGVLPLHAACSGGSNLHEQVVKRLIEAGADVNAPRLPRRYLTDKSRETIVGTTGSTPLHFAAANGNTSIVSTLLQYGAQPDKADKHGVTPEMLARSNGWLECADLLAAAVRQSRKDGSSAVTSGVNEENAPSAGRRRLQVKRSIDNALGKIKSSSTNLNEMYHQAKPTSTPNPREPITPFYSMGDYHFGTPDEGADFPSHAARRPSLPQITVPQRLRKTSTSRPGCRPSNSRRPSSAGNGAEPPSPSVQPGRTQYTAPRKPASKLSFLNLFKKAHGEDGPSTSLAGGTGEQSNGSTSSFASMNFDPVAVASGSGTRSPVSPTTLSSSYNEPPQVPPRRLNRLRQGSEGSTSLARAVDLHNALAQKHHHTNSDAALSVDNDDYRPTARSPWSSGRGRSGSDTSELRCSWRFGSSFDARDRSLSRPPSDSRSKPSILHRRAHSRSTSTGVAPTNVRFDSNSSAGSTRASPGGRLRESNSVGSFGRPSHGSGLAGTQIPESAPAGVEDFARRKQGSEEDEEEEEYGQPISRHSPDSQSRGSIRNPHTAGDNAQDEESFPFDINQPPPPDDTELSASRPSFDRSTLSTITHAPPRGNSRDRGDSLSSAASSNVPELFRSTHSSISSETPPITSPPSHAIASLALAPAQPNDSSPEPSGVGARRQQTPLDINIQDISSHAQAEALVNQARQRILDDDGISILQGSDGAGSGDNVPLSAKLAAFGKSLAVERMFKEERERQASKPANNAEPGDNVTPVSRESEFGLDQSGANSTQRPSVSGRPRRRTRRPNTSEGPATQTVDRFTHELGLRPAHVFQPMTPGRLAPPSPHTDSSSSPRTPAPLPSSFNSYHRSRVRSMDDEDTDYDHPIVGSHTPVDPGNTMGTGLYRILTAPTPNHSARSADKLSRMGFSRAMVEVPGNMTTSPPSKKFGLKSLFRSTKT